MVRTSGRESWVVPRPLDRCCLDHSYRTLKCAHLIFSSRNVVATLALFASSSTRFSSLFLSDRRLASAAIACGGKEGGHQASYEDPAAAAAVCADQPGGEGGGGGGGGATGGVLLEVKLIIRMPHLWGALTSRLDALVEVLTEALVR